MSEEICDCAFGLTGFQGDSGVPGTDGDRGFQGYQGFQGTVGLFGSSGSQGLSGGDGTDGKMGPMGYPGRDGSIGCAGSGGSVGPPGPPGPHGIPGADGAPGPVGSRGYEGSVGPRGPAGTPGLRGNRGFQGHVGTQGSGGAQGSSAGFNLIMESARTQGGIASSITTVNDGDKVRLWSAGGISIGLSSGSALYNLEPNNMISALSSPTLAPSDPFRPSLYLDTSTGSMYMWDPNIGGGGSWIKQTGDGSNGYYGGGKHIKVASISAQALSSAVFVDLTGSTVNLNISCCSLVMIEVFIVVSGTTSQYTLTGNFFQDGLAFDGDPNLIFVSSSSNTQTVQHTNSRQLDVGLYEIKYQLHVGIGESVTIDQHYMKISVIGL